MTPPLPRRQPGRPYGLKNGSQSGSEGFAQLNDSFLRGLRGFEPPRGRGVPPMAKQDPQNPS